MIPAPCNVRKRLLTIILFAWTVLTFVGFSALHAEPYRLIVLPDSQNAMEKFPEVFTNTCNWIVANKEKLNIQYVLHVGDMVEHGRNEQEWQRFDSAMQRLEKSGVPYILAVGNHDFGMINGLSGTLPLFNKYFPLLRFSSLPSFGGNAPAGSAANSYHAFRAGGTNWLVLSLQFMPPDYILDWANRVVQAHPDHQVILLTHSFLEHRGRDKAAEYIWEKLARRHANISMVICGHLSTVHYVDQGDHGNTVYQMLFDWQNPTSPDPNSYCAILELDPEQKTLSVKSYSAMLDKFMADPRGRFDFKDVQFMRKDAAKLVRVESPEAPPQPSLPAK